MSKIMKNIWSLPRYKRGWRDICALLPAYLPDGCNGSMILYEDGGVEQVNFSFSWVIDDLLAYKCSSKTILQQQSSQIAAQMGKRYQRRLPLILNEEFCLVPIRVRLTSSPYHEANGYVRLNRVKDFSEQKGKSGCKIKFINQVELEVLDNMRTLRGNMALAAKMQEYLREEHTSA